MRACAGRQYIGDMPNSDLRQMMMTVNTNFWGAPGGAQPTARLMSQRSASHALRAARGRRFSAMHYSIVDTMYGVQCPSARAAHAHAVSRVMWGARGGWSWPGDALRPLLRRRAARAAGLPAAVPHHRCAAPGRASMGPGFSVEAVCCIMLK